MFVSRQITMISILVRHTVIAVTAADSTCGAARESRPTRQGRWPKNICKGDDFSSDLSPALLPFRERVDRDLDRGKWEVEKWLNLKSWKANWHYPSNPWVQRLPNWLANRRKQPQPSCCLDWVWPGLSNHPSLLFRIAARSASTKINESKGFSL